MKTDITLSSLADDNGDSGDNKRVRTTESECNGDVDGAEAGKPFKLLRFYDNDDVGTTGERHVAENSSEIVNVELNSLNGKTNAVHGIVSVMGRQRAMTTAVSAVVDKIPSYDIFGIFDGLRLAKFFEEKLRHPVTKEISACHGGDAPVDWDKVMKSCFSEAIEIVGSPAAIAAGAVVTVVGKEEVVVLCRGGARVVLYSHGGIALPLCHIHHHERGVDEKLKVHKRTMIDDFIVLACDGLWEVVSDHDTYQLVKSFLRSKPITHNGCESESRTTKAAVILAELAIARGSKQNINVVVIDLS